MEVIEACRLVLVLLKKDGKVGMEINLNECVCVRERKRGIRGGERIMTVDIFSCLSLSSLDPHCGACYSRAMLLSCLLSTISFLRFSLSLSSLGSWPLSMVLFS